MNELSTKPAGREFNFWGLGLTVLVIIAIAYFIDLSSVKVWVEQAGVWGPLVFILLKTSTIVIAPLSGSPLYPLVGLLFGFWPGFLYVVVGDALGYSIAFLLSRIFGKKLINKFLSNQEEGTLGKVIAHAGTP
ncbi:MAG: VTT domain-containing protein [Patescibacteria group bacterium]